ncbi:MAG: transcription antitermination factor NusB [Rhizobiales bacterium]|nr:transcription antitermination factor NusB [Hyphomicrobiales bacterium]
MVNDLPEGGGENGREGNPAARTGGPRSVARLAAVQALYQMEMTGADLNAVIEEFFVHRFPSEGARDTYEGADKAYFASLVRGVVERQREIDPLINGLLAQGWRLARLDSILRAILRAGTLELLGHRSVPAPIVIDEWINVAHAFFSGEEPKVVNGIIDKLARRLRAEEMVPAPVREG